MSSSFCSWHSDTEYIIKKILIKVLPIELVKYIYISLFEKMYLYSYSSKPYKKVYYL